MILKSIGLIWESCDRVKVVSMYYNTWSRNCSGICHSWLNLWHLLHESWFVSDKHVWMKLMYWSLHLQVVLKTQHRDPLGLISILPLATKTQRVFQLILEAAQSFDRVTIKHKRNIAPDCKELLMNLASNPLPLKHQSRVYLRDHLQRKLDSKVKQLDIPVTLQSYLLFEISW